MRNQHATILLFVGAACIAACSSSKKDAGPSSSENDASVGDGGRATGGTGAGGATGGGAGAPIDAGSGATGPADGATEAAKPVTTEAGADAKSTDAGPSPIGAVHYGRWLVYILDGLRLIDVSGMPAPLPAATPLAQSGGYQFQWSPDGHYFAYDAALDHQCLLIDLSGATPGPVVHASAPGQYPGNYYFSPDSKKLAINTNGHLTVVDATSAAPIPTDLGTTKAVSVRWLPDSSGIVFDEGGPSLGLGHTDLYYAALQGVALQKKVQLASSDDSWFGFDVSRTRNQVGIVSGSAGLELQTLGDGVASSPLTLPLGHPGARPNPPAFSNDGGWIMVPFGIAVDSGQYSADTALFDQRSGTVQAAVPLRTILGPYNLAGALFSPDSQWLIVGSVAAPPFFYVSLAGSKPTRKHNTTSFYGDAGFLLGAIAGGFVWSPLSNWIFTGNATSIAFVDPNNASALLIPSAPPPVAATPTSGFSPNGRVFAHIDGAQLVTHDVGGSSVGAPNIVDANGVRNLVWSAGSDKLAYTGVAPPGGKTPLFIALMHGALSSAPIPLDTSTISAALDGQFFFQP